MKENLTKLKELNIEGMILTEQIDILCEMLLLYTFEEPKICPMVDIIHEKAKETSRVFEEIEMMLF